MAEIKFIYFEGCPNADKTRAALKTIGIDFDEINQRDLSESSIFRNYSSPTILQGKNVIFGCETGQGRSGCSLEVPSIDELKNKLGTAVSSNKKMVFFQGLVLRCSPNRRAVSGLYSGYWCLPSLNWTRIHSARIRAASCTLHIFGCCN